MISNVQNINIAEYDYPLPDERIAKYPLAERDSSKLLVLKGEPHGGAAQLCEDRFRNIGDYLPEKSVLVFNETKVVRARLQFVKDSGAAIEVFCLEPVTGNGDYQLAFSASSPVEWHCLVGNSRRWKDGALSMPLNIKGKDVVLKAERIEKTDAYSLVRFSWEPCAISFAEVLEAAGEIPLPPYLHREAEPSDRERYQTVFAKYEGSVAAPTASLHLTKPLIAKLKEMGHTIQEVTLHVGAGTFRPVASDTIGEHEMHSESIIVKRQCIENLRDNIERTIIPVGTTSMRTIESLYWIGVMLLEQGFEERNLHVNQWFPYNDRISLPSAKESLEAILKYLDMYHLDALHAMTALMIAPSCPIKITKALITNFHQPKSTLLLLVSALIGERWKEAYQYAMEHDFRFLSYGDSCLFLPNL
ncbi:MAG: S-adenosylmethionine:tRNA ribosyltransferase-isomerase [Bacteroidales bacterium]|nr:S-adenosylmethionine:tRNA ribosyltransferase-isomerase [Bacteroidales bacterium]